MTASRTPRVLTIHPGSPFLATFAESLLSGRVVEGFGAQADPLDFAAATIFVPTRRAARALGGEIARRLPGRAALLPRVVPLGHMESIETSLLFDSGPEAAGDGPVADVPDAIGEIDRRMALAGLVGAWARRLQHAITHVDGEGIHTDLREPLLVTKSPAQAWHLAGDLAGLIDEMIVEGGDWAALRGLAPDEFDRYWGITLEFLKIATKVWPLHLAERGLVDAAQRQARLVDREIDRLQSAGIGAAGAPPVIAIGSTGTNRATARLLAAIARLPNGAVVLPGLDRRLDDRAWNMIPGDEAQRIEPSAGHPQAALRRLLPTLGVTRAQVLELGAPDVALEKRHDLLSEAFRPADTTEIWPDYLAGLGPSDLADALAGVTLVAAADEREEALAIAVKMRETLETPGRTAALVTPDRALARRVRAELARWNVEIDDSGGEPLATTSHGVVARLVLACMGDACRPAEWLALLAHPLVRLGRRRGEVERLAAQLEIAVLRGVLSQRDDPAALVADAREAAKSAHAHPACRRLSERDWDDIAAFVRDVSHALAPLHETAHACDLPAWIAAHRASLSRLLARPADDAPRSDEAAEALDALLTQLSASAGALPESMKLDFRAPDYRAFVDLVTREAVVRGPARAHPRLKILGLLEARLIAADVMILAGLDEATWPPQPRADAFLNRPMRAELGLSMPERRIGQTAHDFIEALGARDVVVTRATKRGGAPTVPSRFLQRLEALAGPAFAPCRTRGQFLLQLARGLDRPPETPPIRRPRPCPPLDLRPARLSVTEIETLRRDPYSIYARHVLRLEPLEALGQSPGAREAGTQLHDVFAEFVRAHPAGELPPDAIVGLLALARRKLDILLRNPDYRAFQWPRIEAGLGRWLDWDAGRREDVERIDVERDGRMSFQLDDGTTFTLRGRADRLELHAGGGVAILDYKSGRVPSKREIAAGFAPQLPLEVHMVENGAFVDIGARPVVDACHVPIGNVDEVEAQTIVPSGRTLADIVGENVDGLMLLLNEFRKVETPYLARPFPQFAMRYASYDHLARVKEWSAGQDEGEAS